ncbi:D-alanyl-D-alanine carboxypeptidase [Kibdelosporangium banguiense]|uniref:D-alanyl-D-alanine carboxypeptidase n=1 Tax=Kibdelosporangium banguiense TaxID=1365924 RepID=A0ABS4TC58_9PSEU|nr:serine hydrolase domain-containing protein [Kibdelosporangium banguiense]MBP2322003.1 D-alanyl-D-alanine carboxypeptidase [Kibdelosporangium banguiense]
MRKTIIATMTAAAVALTAIPANAATVPPVNEDALKAAISGLPSPDTTGALVRITGSGGQWSGVSGVSDITTNAPVNPNGSFRIGSVTKVFTAVLVLRLAQERKIDLNQPVQRYLPGVLPADYPPIPVYTLLDHTSGLPHIDIPEMADPQWVSDHRFDSWSPSQVLATATKHPHEFTPGSAQKYSNTSYIVAGLLVEKVTGHSYARAVRERITDPLGLCHTYYPGNDPRLPNPAARGYVTVNGKLVDMTEMNQSIPWAAGGIISTAEELDKFITALLGGRLLGPAMMDRLFTVPNVETVNNGGPAMYSQGLQTITLNGVTMWGKTGSRYGYSSGVFATRDLARKAVYSVNATTKSTEGQPKIVLRIADAATR